MAWWRGEKGVRGPSGEREAMMRRGSSSEVEKLPDGREIISRATMIVNLSGCILYKRVDGTKVYKGKGRTYHTVFLTRVASIGR
jgi:hypothetical protein